MLHEGDSIKCYICSSDKDENCRDPINMNDLGATECSTSRIGELYETLNKGLKGFSNLMGTNLKAPDMSFDCQKLVASDDEGKSVTYRTCTIAKSAGVDPCSLTSEIDKYLKGSLKIDHCSTCDSDYCNGARKRDFSLCFALLGTLAAILASYFKL
ncbi:hypothetical protein L9F63_018654 [Diploptera punctata]|uniref:Protein sleepless n=1 Tax=Diploptera punctata TaxID=6984 RepID=A0AAD7ZWC7_DIPPU|nr:hypothetical protein L9F63_018654 [Diploptera punctata]